MLRVNFQDHKFKIWWNYPDKKNPKVKKPETLVFLIQADVENPVLHTASVRKAQEDLMRKSTARKATLEKVLQKFDRDFRTAVWKEYWKVVKE